MKGKTKKWALIASLAALFVFAPMAGTSIANNAMPTAAAEEVATIADTVATIEETGATYGSLSAAIDAATTGQTIELTANVNESVTISKNLTIDGAGKTYTGTMTMNKGLTVTVQDVNFYNAGLTKAKSNTGTYTFKNCTFDGANKAYGYAISFAGASKITVEDCTVKDYSYGFMYFSSSLTTHSVKNVTVENCNYGVRMGSTNTTNLVNFTTKNVKYPVQIQANAARTVNMTNCSFEGTTPAFSCWSGTSKVTFNFKGVNVVDTPAATDTNFAYNAAAQIGTKFYEKFEDVFANAKPGDTIKLWKNYEGDPITLPEGVMLDKNGKTDEDKITVVVPEYVAKIGETGYETLAAAFAAANVAGDYTITLLKDNAETITFAQNASANITIKGETEEIKFTGKITLNAGAGNLTFTNITLTPSNADAKTIVLNASTAPNITIDGCTMKNVGTKGAIVWGQASYTDNKVVITNSTASYLQYLVGTNQTGCEDITIENVTATNMAYLVRPMKAAKVTVKDVTYSGLTFVQVKNSNKGTLAIENVNVTTTQAGMPPITMLAPDSGTPTAMYTITLKGENIVNGAAMTKANESAWFATAAAGLLYEIVADADMGCNLSLGEAITLNFHVYTAAYGSDIAYTFGWADGSDIEFKFDVVVGDFVSIYQAFITPQLMDKEVTLTIGDYTKTMSVVECCSITFDSYEDEALRDLLADTLRYGVASQKYMNVTEFEMDAKYNDYGTAFEAPANNYVKGTDVEGIDFGDSNVAFNNTNKLVWYFIVTDDTATVTLTKNGVAVEDKSGKFMEIAKPTTYMGVECYMIETDDIMATELDASYVLTVAGANGTVTVKFSVADYVAYHANSNSADANLAKALWCYGQSAKAYNA